MKRRLTPKEQAQWRTTVRLLGAIAALVLVIPIKVARRWT